MARWCWTLMCRGCPCQSLLDFFKAGQGVMRLLLWGAATGRVAGILSGLPKHNALEHTLQAVVLNEVAVAGRVAMLC